MEDRSNQEYLSESIQQSFSANNNLEIKQEKLDYDESSDPQDSIFPLSSADVKDEYSQTADEILQRKYEKKVKKIISDTDEKFSQNTNNSNQPEVLYYNASENKPQDDNTFFCKICEKSFMNNSNFRRHKRIHSSSKPYRCDVCGNAYRESSDLKKHKKIHPESLAYEGCNDSLVFLENGSDAQPTVPKLFPCSDCGKTFAQLDYVRRHKRTHNQERPYSCEDCGSLFKHSYSLKKHTRLFHGVKSDKKITPTECKLPLDKESESNDPKPPNTPVKSFYCDICGRIFEEENALNTHREVHKGKLFTCKECGENFALAGNLKRHEFMHTGQSFLHCDECGHSFTCQSDLDLHKLLHRGGKPYSCKECGKSFAIEAHLKRHNRVHTGEKPYNCHICGSFFVQAQNLKKHILTHTGVKDFFCNVCSRQFAVESSLKRHMNIHTCTERYPCDVCGRKFTLMDNLRRHKMLHTGIRPFACDQCDKTFVFSDRLKKHKIAHHTKS